MATSLVFHLALAHSPLSGTGEQMSDPVRADAGAALGDPFGAELGPVLVQKLELALLNSTR
jgi:hypothetical protein